MPYPSLNLDKKTFLDEVWQKKPLVIRQGLENFIDPLDEHDLAGLAQEPDIDSRIVSFHQDNWHISHGPFEDFAPLCQGKWTLMVQGVDRWIDDVFVLSKAFNFIPHWRFDDVMVSFSVPGAGVGPHVDQYDVFLVQGKGKRRWKVGTPETVIPKPDNEGLQQVENFNACIDIELEPGDILYIPPGWPHCGTSIEPTLTYSMGFRAPNARDLLQPINDGIFNREDLLRYRDDNLSNKRSPDQVTHGELQSLTQLISQSLTGDDWYMALLQHLSEQNLAAEPLNDGYTSEQILAFMDIGESFIPLTGVRPISCERYPNTLFINGQSYDVPNELHNEVLEAFNTSNAMCFTNTAKNTTPTQKLQYVSVLTQWVNAGVLLLD